MDLSRSFCSAAMKGSFKCSAGGIRQQLPLSLRTNEANLRPSAATLTEVTLRSEAASRGSDLSAVASSVDPGGSPPSRDQLTAWGGECLPTWQLRVNPVRQVLLEVAGHLSTDVYQHSGLGGGDLVDEDRARLGQHQLSVVRLKLGTVLDRKCKDASETRPVAKLPTRSQDLR